MLNLLDERKPSPPWRRLRPIAAVTILQALHVKLIKPYPRCPCLVTATLYRGSLMAAFVLFWISLSHWLIRLSLPTLAPPAAQPVNVVDRSDHAAQLFGAPLQVQQSTRFKLSGIIQMQHAAALISHDDGPALAIGVGNEVVPGVILEAIDSQSVRLRQAGLPIQLNLPAAASSSAIILR